MPESVNEANWEIEQLTDSASRRKVRRGSTKAFSFFFAEGLTSGIWPSYICSTTDSGDMLSSDALARISLRVCSHSLTTLEKDPEINQQVTLSPIPLFGVLIALENPGTKWGLSIICRYARRSLICGRGCSNYPGQHNKSKLKGKDEPRHAQRIYVRPILYSIYLPSVGRSQ